MRFKEFILEDKKFDLEKFKHDCAFALEQLKGTKGRAVLFRGSFDIPKDTAIRTWSERSGPKDTNIVIHDAMNDYFTKKFGDPIRNWLFCCYNANRASIYSPGSSSSSLIFPIGKFEWVAAEDDDAFDMTDFVATITRYIKTNNPDVPWDDRVQLVIAEMKKQMNKWNWYHNTDLVGAIKSRNEVMIKCDKYYVIRFQGPTWDTPEWQEFLLSI